MRESMLEADRKALDELKTFDDPETRATLSEIAKRAEAAAMIRVAGLEGLTQVGKHKPTMEGVIRRLDGLFSPKKYTGPADAETGGTTSDTRKQISIDAFMSKKPSK
jgi:hypothetical protein